MAGDARQSLVEDICMILISNNIMSEDVKNDIVMTLDRYEIQTRTTDVALLQQDRNDYLIKKFLIAKTVKGCTQRTIEFYRNQLNFTFRMIGKTIDDIEADDIRYYLALRQRRDHVTCITADNELRALKTFYQYLSAEEIITRNPLLKVERIKGRKQKKEALTDLEIERLRLAADGERESMIIEVLLSTGCRVSELANIRLDDIDGNKVLVHGKGEKDRTVYLNAKAQVAIECYMNCREDNNPYLLAGGTYMMISKSKKGISKKDYKSWWKDKQYVTEDTHLNNGTIEMITRNMAKRAGVGKANPHKFRRTCATLALRRGMPIEQVSKMLGHENISTTQIYLDLTDEELEQYHKKYVV